MQVHLCPMPAAPATLGMRRQELDLLYSFCASVSSLMDHVPQLMLFLLTKDRKGYVQLVRKVFAAMRATDFSQLVLLDDASTEYSVSDLKAWFPAATVLSASKPGRAAVVAQAYRYVGGALLPLS